MLSSSGQGLKKRPPPPPPPRSQARMGSAVQVYTPQTMSYEVSLKKGIGQVSKRLVVVELQKHLVTQKLSNESKSHPCREYSRLRRRGAEIEVVLDDNKGKRRKKFMVFRSATQALSFEQVITLEKHSGDTLQILFNQIDKDASGRIGSKDLELSLAECSITEANVKAMIDLVGDGSDSLAYAAFFQLFLDYSDISRISTARECLLHWERKASTRKTNNIVTNTATQGKIALSLEASLAPSDCFLPGEKLAHIVEHVMYSIDQTHMNTSTKSLYRHDFLIELTGVLYVTNYRLRIVAYESCLQSLGLRARAHKCLGRGVPEQCFGDLSQPHGATHRIDTQGTRELRILSRDNTRCLNLRFEADAVFVDTVKKTLEDHAFPRDPDQISEKAHADVARAEHTFAFSYQLQTSPLYTGLEIRIDGWNLFQSKKEYARLGFFEIDEDTKAIKSTAWRLWADQYQLSDTYPFEYVVPKIIKESALEEAAKYRSKRRLPVAVWRSKKTGAVLCRSSQPMAGLSQKSSRADQALLDLYRTQGQVRSSRQKPIIPPATFANNKACPTSPSQTSTMTRNKRISSSMKRFRSISVLDRPLHIVDCRGRTAALANHAQGKGTETVTDYKNTTLKYCDIGNIHTMRESQQSLVETLALFGEKLTDPDQDKCSVDQASLVNPGGGSSKTRIVSSAAAASANKPSKLTSKSNSTAASSIDTSFLSNLEATGWLKHLLLLLRAATHVADRLENQGASCLVHCSDGWDRTAQVCALTQILLDPYYRTLEGFAVLIEKEWCAFGHKFADRLGIARRPDFRERERSPIFIQWLEAVAFIIEQFPRAFEFNEDLLVFIADASTSALFGTFLADTERQRKWEMRAPKRTVSIWTYVLNCPQSRFKNSDFLFYKGPLWPYVNTKRIHVWHRFYSRWDPAMHPPAAPLLGQRVWLNDYGDHFQHAHHSSIRSDQTPDHKAQQSLHEQTKDTGIEDDDLVDDYDEEEEDDDEDDQLVVVDDPIADYEHNLSQRSFDSTSESSSRKFSNPPFVDQEFYL